MDPTDLSPMKKECLRTLLVILYGKFCYLCKEPFTYDDPPTIDHLAPLSRETPSGLNHWSIENLAPMHRVCNSRKSDRILLPDGTLEPPLRPEKNKIPRHYRKQLIESICKRCNDGRMLLPGELCAECGSGPKPEKTPGALKRDPRDCDHANYHCWMCWLGIVKRSKPIEEITNV